MNDHDVATPREHGAEPEPPSRDLDEDRRQLGREGLQHLPDAEAPGDSVTDEDEWAAVEPNEPG